MPDKPSYGEIFFEQITEHDQSMFFIGYFDKTYSLLRIDGACLELTGFHAEELILGKDINFLGLIYLEDRKWLRLKRQEQMDHHLPIVNEYRMICRQGKVKWVREILSAKKDETSDQIIIEGMIKDITPFKTNVFMSNAFTSFQNAVNNGSIVSITDKKGKILFVNDNFVLISKYSRQELIGNDHRIINSGFHSTAFFTDLWLTILSGNTWRNDIKNKAKDGTYYWVDTVITPVMNEKGEIDQFLSIRNVITEQKENEHALLESEALNVSVLKSLHTNIAILDEKGNIVKVNENWIDFTKNSDGRNLFVTTLGANYFDVIKKSADLGDEYAEKIHIGLGEVLNNKVDFFEMEYPCILPGNQRWFIIHISKFQNDITRIIISHFEITQRKRQEEILRKSQFRMQEAQRIAKIGSWEHDFELGELFWSDETYNILGVDKAEFKTNFEHFLQLVHPEDREIVNLAYTESVKNKTSYNIDHRIILSDGSIKYVNERCETFYNAMGRPIKSIGSTQDITRQMEFEMTLEKQRTRYKNVVENISDGLIIDDVHGHVIFANQQFMDMLGIAEEELKDFVFVEHVAPEFKDAIIERHQRRMAGEDVSTIFEYAGFKTDGSKRWFEARVTKIVENNVIKGTQSAIRDITDTKNTFDMLKASEEEKTILLNELTNRYGELMQFNYIVSHNLRAPIANLLGLSEVFEMPNIDDVEKSKIIGHIRFSIEKIDELVQDLNIILAARSDINSKKELVDFEEIIVGVRHTLERQIIETGTQINLFIGPEASHIFSIKSYIKSSIYNLLSNAIKYRHPDRHPIVNIEIEKIHQRYHIKFSDNGMGVDMKRYGKDIFGLYKRFNYSVEGKGLGLNMTKAQVEALGGTISIKSELNKGTEFTIILPETIEE